MGSEYRDPSISCHHHQLCSYLDEKMMKGLYQPRGNDEI